MERELNKENIMKTSDVDVTIKSFWIKLGFLFCCIFVVTASLTYRLMQFNSTDQLPELSIIDAKKQREFGAFTVKVETGMYIKNFPAFDIIKNIFLIDCVVWFNFLSDELMVDTIEKFSFENGRIVQKSPPDIIIDGEKTFVRYDVRVELKSNLRYDRFPLEDHILIFVLSNNFVTPMELFFVVSDNDFLVSSSIFISNWKIIDKGANAGYISSALSKDDEEKKSITPKALFYLKMQKDGIRKVFTVVIPILFALLLTLLAFLMNVENSQGRQSLAASGLTALIGYRFVIEQMMPEVGYFTMADLVYISSLVFSLACFSYQIFFLRLVERKIKRLPYDFDNQQEIKRRVFENHNTAAFYIMTAAASGVLSYIFLR